MTTAVRRAIRAACVLLALAAADAGATEWFVETSGLAFSPQFITIQAGDSVTFLNLGGFHNVVADDGSFRCAHGCDGDGQGGSGNASSELWLATVAFPTPGTVGYFCEPHGAPGYGMYGSIQVLAPPAKITPAPGGQAWSMIALTLLLAGVAAFRFRRSARAVERGFRPVRDGTSRQR